MAKTPIHFYSSSGHVGSLPRDYRRVEKKCLKNAIAGHQQTAPIGGGEQVESNVQRLGGAMSQGRLGGTEAATWLALCGCDLPAVSHCALGRWPSQCGVTRRPEGSVVTGTTTFATADSELGNCRDSGTDSAVWYVLDLPAGMAEFSASVLGSQECFCLGNTDRRPKY